MDNSQELFSLKRFIAASAIITKCKSYAKLTFNKTYFYLEYLQDIFKE